MKATYNEGGVLKKAKVLLMRHFAGYCAWQYPQLEARGWVQEQMKATYIESGVPKKAKVLLMRHFGEYRAWQYPQLEAKGWVQEQNEGNIQ